MKSALVHFEPAQKQRLTRRARRSGKSFSQEVRNAVNLYLTLPVETEEELSGLASAARQSVERTLKCLDGAIAAVHRVLKNKGSGKSPGKSCVPRPFVRRRGDAYYLVCKVRHKRRVRQVSLARLGERPRITDDVIRQVSRTYPLLNLDWTELREQINSRVIDFELNPKDVQESVSLVHNLVALWPSISNLSGTAGGRDEILAQLRRLHSSMDVQLRQFGESSAVNRERLERVG